MSTPVLLAHLLGLNPLSPAAQSSMAVLPQVAIAGLWVVGIGAIAEWGHRKGHLQGEAARKIVHLGSGNVMLLAWWLHLPSWALIVAALLFSALALVSYSLPILPGVNSVGRKSLGTFFYAVSIGLLTWLFWDQQPLIAVMGILVMTWGDGLAGWLGQTYGRSPYQLLGIKKSWEGSGVMALVSLVVMAMGICHMGYSPEVGLLVAAFGALLATGLEAFSWYGIDNLTVPVGVAIAIAELLKGFD
jgi:phytol kinase